MPQTQLVKFTNFTNADETKKAVALDKVSYDGATEKIKLYSSLDNEIKEEATIPYFSPAEKTKLSEIENGATNVGIDSTLTIANSAAEAKATGDALKEVIKVGSQAGTFTSMLIGTTTTQYDFIEQNEFDSAIADLEDTFENHTHAWTDITGGGTLPVTNGGTGITASPSMLVNLGSTSAATVFQNAPRPGVTGTLPVANGGSGVTQTRATTTPSNVITAASGFSIKSVNFGWWGRVATFHIVFTKNSTAITTPTLTTMGTLKDGFRPIYNASGNMGWDKNVVVESGGAIKHNGTFSANTDYGVYSTYVLANKDVPL